jgi:hypothetical protein
MRELRRAPDCGNAPLWGTAAHRALPLLYVILWNTGGRGVSGWEWLFVILAIFGDLASYAGSRYGRWPAY